MHWPIAMRGNAKADTRALIGLHISSVGLRQGAQRKPASTSPSSVVCSGARRESLVSVASMHRLHCNT